MLIQIQELFALFYAANLFRTAFEKMKRVQEKLQFHPAS